VLAPIGTPRAVVERLNGEILRALREPLVRDALVAQGIEVTPSTPEAFQELMRSHLAKWSRVVAEAGIKLE
jgi:tripartite-type tricarboxylate transporter receptor subunit TctC